MLTHLKQSPKTSRSNHHLDTAGVYHARIKSVFTTHGFVDLPNIGGAAFVGGLVARLLALTVFMFSTRRSIRQVKRRRSTHEENRPPRQAKNHGDLLSILNEESTKEKIVLAKNPDAPKRSL